jgi:hypothetical protein
MPLTLSSAQKRSSLPLVLAVVPVFTLHQYIQERDPVAVAATGLLLLVIGIWLAVSARIVEPDRPVLVHAFGASARGVECAAFLVV